MAYLRRIPKRRVWIAGFYDATGKAVQKSTGTRNKADARKIAELWERPHRERIAAAKMLEGAHELYKQMTGADAPQMTLREFSDAWLSSKGLSVKDSTADFYRNTLTRFLAFMGDTADLPIHTIEQRHINDYKTARVKQVTAKTINHDIKALRTFFKDARRQRYIAENPAEFVETVKTEPGRKAAIRPFTLPEIRSVLAACNMEWRSLCMFALYTGQRLGDLACMTWAQIDLQHDIVKFTTAKTGRFQELPISPPLRDHIMTLPAGDDPNAYVHPEAAASHGAAGGRSVTLSNQFGDVLAAAGLRVKQPHRKKASGDDTRRKIRSPLSFHSWRHTATSIMKNAGIPAAIVQDYIGHDSEEMSKLYTSIDMDAKRKAAAALPSIEELTGGK